MYKRQGFRSAREPGGLLNGRTVPVSYTHLDVYKRQAEGLLGTMGISNLGEQIAEKVLGKWCRWTRRGLAADSFLKQSVVCFKGGT